MSRVDGIHFPTGQDMSTRLLDVLDPTSTTVMNEPEARWHYAAMRAQFPELALFWRASPDKKPADLGWDAHAYSREIFRSLDAHADANNGEYPLNIVLLNELNLDYERGEDHYDGGAWDTNPDHWPGLYEKLATFLGDLLVACRERFRDRHITPRFWFPGWSPGHGEQLPEILALWKPTADQFDGICFHAYRDAETITRYVQWYAGTFPEKPLLLGEWNSDGFPNDRLYEELRIRSRLQALGRVYPQLRACYFIWAWAQDAQRKSYDIEGNPDREALWNGIEEIPYDAWGDPVSPPTPEPAPEPAPEPTPPGDTPVPITLPRGIDIASYQGYPDWDAVRNDGVLFAFLKATEGTNYTNETFAVNWPRIPRPDVRRATYHFARPDLNLPEDEADFFWAVVQAQGVERGDVFAVDVEDYMGSLGRAMLPVAPWTLRWLKAFRDISETRPMLYIARNVIVEHGFDQFPEFAEFGLWFAAWADQFPPVPAPWDFIAVWQANAEGRVAGIDGKVDTDYFNGPIENFTKYGYLGADPTPEPAPEPSPAPEPVPGPPPPAVTPEEQQIADLRRVLGYATHEIPDAVTREITTIKASLGALEAAVDELRRQDA